MRTQRGLVDYALRRRAVLAEVMTGRRSIDDVCDATPYLIRAAKYHGVVTDQPCPLCRKEPLTSVFWIYGDEIKHLAGSARKPEELETLAGSFHEFTVHQVEVCRTCSWNHLIASFVMGTDGQDEPQRRPRRRAAK